MEAEYNHLNHATWECKYHVAFTPTYRKKVLFGARERMRVVLGAVDDGRQGQQLYRHGGFSACRFRSFVPVSPGRARVSCSSGRVSAWGQSLRSDSSEATASVRY